jgi:hypothetical protein
MNYQQRIADNENLRLEKLTQKGKKNITIIYDNFVSPPTYGDLFNVVMLARHLALLGHSLSFYIICKEYRDDWGPLIKQKTESKFIEEQVKLVTVLTHGLGVKIDILKWSEYSTHLSSTDNEDITLFHELIKARERIYHYCFNLLNLMMDRAPVNILNYTLLRYNDLSQEINTQINNSYITWHCRFSKKWDFIRNLSQDNFIEIYQLLRTAFPNDRILIVSDEEGCNHFKHIAKTNNLQCIFSNDYTKSYIGSGALILGSKFCFAYKTGGVTQFPMFSRIPYVFVVKLMDEYSWDNELYVPWQSNQQVWMHAQEFIPEYFRLINYIKQNQNKPIDCHFKRALPYIESCEYKKAHLELIKSININEIEAKIAYLKKTTNWNTKNLLANCYAKQDKQVEAIEMWNKIINGNIDSYLPYYDYAKYLTFLNQNTDALAVLLNGINSVTETINLWELGCSIVNSDKDLEAAAMEWTNEALRQHPDSKFIKEHNRIVK